MTLYRSGDFTLRLSAESEKTLCANQKAFVQEDVWAGMIYAYFQDCREDYLCSRQLYSWALLKGNDPEIRETREICEIVNTGIASGEITGWKPLKNPRRFGEYGTQRGWERVNKTPAPE
ncbi:MAG: virulence-associated protein E, partial [Oscillospiraceae bacterium]|nr:virulence-associated protein E [Oscillospiraceae bacterium]